MLETSTFHHTSEIHMNLNEILCQCLTKGHPSLRDGIVKSDSFLKMGRSKIKSFEECIQRTVPVLVKNYFSDSSSRIKMSANP